MAGLGMNKKDFHIELKDNLLTITSEQNGDNSPSEDKLWLRREFSYQSFNRSLRLNKNVVDDAKIYTTYQMWTKKIVAL